MRTDPRFADFLESLMSDGPSEPRPIPLRSAAACGPVKYRNVGGAEWVAYIGSQAIASRLTRRALTDHLAYAMGVTDAEYDPVTVCVW